MQLLTKGRAEQAAWTLVDAPIYYRDIVTLGINCSDAYLLQAVLAALKVMVDALVQTGKAGYISEAELINADVEEMEAILAGYWEGVLEETRRELQQQRRAVAAAAVAPEVAPAAAAQISKAAKWKQEQGEKQELKDEMEKVREEDCRQEAVVTMATALAAMAVDEKEESQHKENEEECSVCLKVIEHDDADNPAGPLLICGHYFHESCLGFWMERCLKMCIEPTCPYCQSLLQDPEST